MYKIHTFAPQLSYRIIKIRYEKYFSRWSGWTNRNRTNPHLQKNYGYDNVVAADLRADIVEKLSKNSIATTLDALDAKSYADIVKKYKIDAIYNLVALLSATGEKIRSLHGA